MGYSRLEQKKSPAHFPPPAPVPFMHKLHISMHPLGPGLLWISGFGY
jgi:hypothetical protein